MRFSAQGIWFWYNDGNAIWGGSCFVSYRVIIQMLDFIGEKKQAAFCDGISRRSFLRIGGLGLGGLTLPQLLRKEAAAGQGGSQNRSS